MSTRSCAALGYALSPPNPRVLSMKATLVFLLFGCALLTAACVPATAAGAPAALPQASVTQPAPAASPVETSVPTETPVPAATAEPTATTVPTNTPATESIRSTPIPLPEQTAADQSTVSADGAEPIDTALLELDKEVHPSLNGNRRSRCPVRAKTALPIAGATGPMAGSPTPLGWPSLAFIRTTSTSGDSRIVSRG